MYHSSISQIQFSVCLWLQLLGLVSPHCINLICWSFKDKLTLWSMYNLFSVQCLWAIKSPSYTFLVFLRNRTAATVRFWWMRWAGIVVRWWLCPSLRPLLANAPSRLTRSRTGSETRSVRHTSAQSPGIVVPEYRTIYWYFYMPTNSHKHTGTQ
jgi:hypothetical protein